MDSISSKALDDALKRFSEEQIKSATKSAMTFLMVVEFIGVVGIYVLLKMYASPHYAELWMFAVYGWTLKNATDLCEKKTLKQLEKRLRDNEAEENTSKDKAIEECNGKDNASS